MSFEIFDEGFKTFSEGIQGSVQEYEDNLDSIYKFSVHKFENNEEIRKILEQVSRKELFWKGEGITEERFKEAKKQYRELWEKRGGETGTMPPEIKTKMKHALDAEYPSEKSRLEKTKRVAQAVTKALFNEEGLRSTAIILSFVSKSIAKVLWSPWLAPFVWHEEINAILRSKPVKRFWELNHDTVARRIYERTGQDRKTKKLRMPWVEKGEYGRDREYFHKDVGWY